MNPAAAPSCPPVPIRSRSAAAAGFQALLFLFAFALIWCSRAYGTPLMQRWSAPAPFSRGSDLGIAVAALFLAVLAHECGHFLAALLLGFEFLGASIGPVQIQTLHRKWKMSVSWKHAFSGSVSALPRTMQHWRAAMLITVAAGPAATLTAGLVMASLAFSGAGFALFQLTFVQVSALIFLLGFIPNSRAAGRRNDMRMILDLARRTQGCEEIELYLLQTQHLLNGEPPADYPPALIARLASWRGRPETELTFALALVRWAADSGQWSLVEAWDKRALALADHCQGKARNGALALSACLSVIHDGDLETARLKFQHVDDSALFPPCLEHLSRAARHVALGHSYRAPASIIRAQYALPPGIPSYSLERTLIDRLHMLAMRPAGYRAASA